MACCTLVEVRLEHQYMAFLTAHMGHKSCRYKDHTLVAFHTDSGFSSLDSAQIDQSQVLGLGWEFDQ